MKLKFDLNVFCRNFVRILLGGSEIPPRAGLKFIQNDTKLKFDLKVFCRDFVGILLGGSEVPAPSGAKMCSN